MFLLQHITQLIMQQKLESFSHIQALLELERNTPNRRDFHKAVAPLLVKMGSDTEFLKAVIRRNFTDSGYLSQVWSGYNIPFFYVYETEHFNLKIHLFPPIPPHINRNDVAAHCIHHHNNYMLTTHAFFGSGYESMLFSKNPQVNPSDLSVNMEITRHFHQKDWDPSTVDSWEPHVVFIPEKLSATLLIWTPDKKRLTDKLRHVPALKSVKKHLRWLIHKLGLTANVGIAEEKTYQFYPNPNSNNTFTGIEESVYFAPTKAETGPQVNAYSAQMIMAFIQRSKLFEPDFFEKQLPDLPPYYRPFIEKALRNEPIPDVYHRTQIHIPQKTYYREDIIKAAQSQT